MSRLATVGKYLFRLLAALLILLLLVCGYWYLNLTSPVTLTGILGPTAFDSREAARKLALIEGAQATGRSGFVRFGEAEINSYLEDLFTRSTNNSTPLDWKSARALKARVDLGQSQLLLAVWLEKNLLGTRQQFAMQRLYTLHSGTNDWSATLIRLHVGDLEIPPALWPRVDGLMDLSADPHLLNRLGWLQKIPILELKPNEITQTPEIHIHSHPAVATPVAVPKP